MSVLTRMLVDAIESIGRSRVSSALERRSFDRTGEKVSVIGLGGAALYKHSSSAELCTGAS